MKTHYKHFFFVFLFFTVFSSLAQLYPVQMTPVFMSPYSSKLSDYATSLDTRFQLIVNPTDISINQRQVKLKMFVTGNGLSFQSTDFVVGLNPIFINGGEIQTFTNVDLAALFRLENLQGISAVQYASPLPEGNYFFCFEMYDFATNQRITSRICAPLYLMLNDPPLLNLPTKNEQIAVTDFPNILFTWTPRSINATNVSYEFEMKDILDANISPEFGFAMSPMFYSDSQFGTSLIYDSGKPTLIPNHRYAWRVKAISTSGLSTNAIFKNDGYSEVFWFKFASACPSPSQVLSEPKSATSVKITWAGNPSNTKYHLQYRKAASSNPSQGGGNEWFSIYTLNTQANISDLQAGVTYDYRVGASCEPASNAVSYTYSGINTFFISTTAATTTSFSCGINPAIAIANQTPLQNLLASETFTASDFSVKVLEVTGSNGIFSGKGYITVPYLADTKIAVEFENIEINTNYQLINGVVVTTYDPSWVNVQDIQPLIDDIISLINNTIQNLQTLITQSQNTQSPIDPTAWATQQQLLNTQWQLLFNNANLPQDIQTQITQLAGNGFLASTSNTPPNANSLGTTQQQLTQLAAIQANIQDSQKGIEKLIAALRSFGTDTFIKCKKCEGTQSISGLDGSLGIKKTLTYFGKKYACLMATLNTSAPITIITDNLNNIPVNSNNAKIKKLANDTKTIFNASKPELLVLFNQNDELVDCEVKYLFSGTICTTNFSVSDATFAQISEEVNTCFVNKIQEYLIGSNSTKRQNQSIEFENNGKIYTLDTNNKAIIVVNPLTDAQINSGSWTDTIKDVKIRYLINSQGILQFRAVGIRNNLQLAVGKQANLIDLAQNIKNKGNIFFNENRVTNGIETPASKSINLNMDAEEFADGKKIAIDNNSTFFKIASEGIGLVTTLLKTAVVEDNAYLNTTENTATIHAPGLVTGTVEAGTKVVTDITGIVVMVYDISVDKEARKQTWEGLKKIKTQIGNDYSQLIPMLKNVIIEEATGNTPESWSEINNQQTDNGRKDHLSTKGAVRTCVTIFTASTIITKLPEMADKLVSKLDNLAASSLDDLLGFINKTLAQKLQKITNIWSTKFPIQEMFEGRTFFEDIMGHYRYLKSNGWMHTGDISPNFKGVDFYKGTTQGTNIFAETAVSMKTTITTNVDTWLASAPMQKNIGYLEQGLDPAKGLSSNGKNMLITNAEIHVYMPKANITDALKTTWMNKLNSVNPKIKFEIKSLEDFIN